MKKTYTHLMAAALTALLPTAASAQDTVTHTIFDGVTFYDGYRVQDFSAGVDSTEDVLHHYTYLYAKKLTDDVLNNIGQYVSLEVFVKACCDNYDRIGNINLALVPKGQATYSIDNVERIELGRFITPFMDKNKQPDTVPYAFSVHYLSLILRDADLRSKYDFWLEYELFGVPYAANTQIDGCEGRSDVFQGTLNIVTTTPALGQTTTDVLVPICIKSPEYTSKNLNNYGENSTDTIGKTTKTYTFTVPKDCSDAQIVLVTSNHGSNSGGEEYNRRWHYIYVDDELALTYKPGRPSCEPFRKYNTQANGIYNTTASDYISWQSFSNWCPGDAIDNRIIRLGAVKAGDHKVRISVPDAVFNGSQGYIPVSIFFQGVTDSELTTISEAPTMEHVADVSIQDGRLVLSVTDSDNVANVDLYDVQGKHLYHSATANDISLSSYPKGIYLVNIETADGIVETHKILKK